MNTYYNYINKNKIFNDPVYGLITLPYTILFDLIEHPYFQRLRHISQLGLTYFVYPGAHHTRFHHALGAMHLMQEALESLRSKGHHISEIEAEGVCIAILLHDIGHGPFSHALEKSIVNVHHEEISLCMMKQLNIEFQGKLDIAIAIFEDKYPKKYLHQLVSSQLDVDRLDYLKRDSFYTGVSEGIVGSERIIKMMNIADGELVVEEKAIYSIEKYLMARRLMYWQVYLHKTVVSAESLLVKVLQRATYVHQNNLDNIFLTAALKYFMCNIVLIEDFDVDNKPLFFYNQLDDSIIWTCMKEWQFSNDYILSYLSKKLVNRKLFKLNFYTDPIDAEIINGYKKAILDNHPIEEKDLEYFIFEGEVSNHAYNNTKKGRINLQLKDGSLLDLKTASIQLESAILSKKITRNYLCFDTKTQI